jgi:D-alanyl-D-alanine carboxypeptidase/D-alanyl-D-alanine-endopeptidase (penicillin-binding protein 4)
MSKLLLIICLLGSNLILSQNYSEIHDFVTKHQNSKLLKNASWSVSARYLGSGEKIASLNSELAIAPASNMKLITTSAALDILGEDYKFVTRIYSDGEIDNAGNLMGNVYIVGGGDPSLGYNLVDLLMN